MRFLTKTDGHGCINLDCISGVSIMPDKYDHTFVLIVSADGISYRFYRGDFIDVKTRYINLIKILSNMNTPTFGFITNDSMVIMKDDGTFICEENSIWEININEVNIYKND